MLLAVPAMGAMAGLLACTPGAGGADAGGGAKDRPDAASSTAVSSAAATRLDDHAALLAGLPEDSPGDLGPMRLADGLVPPTNRWFSGLVFGDAPQPVFPLPLSVAVTGSGVEVGAPRPVASPAAVVGPHVAALTLDVGLPVEPSVVAYDAAAVTVALTGADGEVARLELAQGSPFVTLVAGTDLEVGVRGGTGDLGPAGEPAGAELEVAGRTFGLWTEGGAGSADGVRLEAGGRVTLALVPDDATRDTRAALARAAEHAVVRATVGWELGDVARTTLDLRGEDDEPSLVVAIPHHARPEGCLGTYPSVHGTLALCPGPLVTQVPALEAAVVPDLDGLGDEVRAGLVEQLRADVAAAPPYPSDTYFGAKALHRSATLVALGRELDAEDVVAPEAERVEAALREWADPDGCVDRDVRCFVHDPVAHAVVGLEPSFGSEELNDHHFHHGYLLSAAGILAADDPALAEDLAPVLDAVAADIASPVASDLLPALRGFDVYRGHSWASGTAPFADGNNQESTSEAVAAWNGLALWARATGDAALETQARWLLSTEAATARTSWTEPDLDDPALAGFERQVFSIVWSAKRDHATWFSAEPNAILGIQLIPMVPVDGALAADAAHVRAAVDEATPGGFGVQFGEYLAMYLALVDPAAARDAYAQVPDDVLDGATSRAYVEAWLAAPPERAG